MIQQRTAFIPFSTLYLYACIPGATGCCDIHCRPKQPAVTLLSYLNGDNDRTQEVLHASDKMEAAGPSDIMR